MLREGVYITETVSKVVLQKLIPAQIRHLILYISNTRLGVLADTIRRRGGSSGSATCCSLSSAETFKLPPPTNGPWWGHSRCGLGAVGAVLEPFCGRLSPKVDEIFQN